MQTMQQFCLRWNNHQPNFISVFTALLTDETLVDVTLACEGKHLQAHKVVLSACSAYFQSLFTANPCQHPIVILKDIRFSDLKTMVDFMYYGEVNVSQEQLPAILKIAEMLKIKGLADMPNMSESMRGHTGSKENRRSVSPLSPLTRRKRLRKSSTGSGSGSTEQTSEELINEGISVHSPSLKAEALNDGQRTISRQSFRNSNQQASTDSETKEGSQDSGAEECKRQQSNDSRQLSFENRQISVESRELSHDSRQSSMEGRQLSVEGTKPTLKDERQGSRESRLSQDSSVDSIKTEPDSGVALSSFGQLKVGTKRGRLLMRQQRIKKESEAHTSPDSDPGSPSFPTMTLTIPGQPLRQRSEPTPLSHSPPSQTSNSNLLSVPQPTFPIRQHSYPSQSPPNQTGAVYIHRHSQTPTVVKCVPTATDETPRGTANSPSIVMETVPIVRIFSESNLTKTNSLLLQQRAEDLKAITESPDFNRSGHCPVLRAGPALGCNYCWNTIDAHGRILRRKTKYHCPECQTNLCIVPCFQQYHTTHAENTERSEQASPS
ncbi:hypothetical protein RUM44_009926 [Polyplax serrata]|uniref:BTB domain-containing protein n=1 Tax=Polyplax serrata TaxID=468196 RepID=A0ABR1AU20_POLSC